MTCMLYVYKNTTRRRYQSREVEPGSLEMPHGYNFLNHSVHPKLPILRSSEAASWELAMEHSPAAGGIKLNKDNILKNLATDNRMRMIKL